VKGVVGREWHLNPGASVDTVREAAEGLGLVFPDDYVEFICRHDGGEGVIGESYLILWKIEELGTFNREYGVARFAPGILLFGSNGGGEGYGWDARVSTMPVIRLPFVGMDLRYVRPVVSWLFPTARPVNAMRGAVRGASGRDRRRPLGMELCEVMPTILGGDPVDPANKIWLTRQQHFEAARYWNRIVREVSEGKASL
jgi:SMI1 / KNR4 family (SUKH-1)